MQRHGQPRTRDHKVHPPLRIYLRVLLVLVDSHSPPIFLHFPPCLSPPSLQLRLPRQPQEIAGHTAEPEAVRPKVYPRSRGIAFIYARDEC
jgi:hypothetical protein